MRLFALVALVMVAFAANSVLTRAGVGHMDVASFGVLRLWSGAVILLALCLWTRRRMVLLTRARLLAVPGLLLYIVGFTEAYIGMDAGLGALLLFGTVQMTMLLGAVILRERLPVLRLAGGAVALAGLVYLVWPWQDIARYPMHVVFMGVAGLGWGLYSLAGKGSRDALSDTAVNFAVAAVFYSMMLLTLDGQEVRWDGVGIALAVASGAIASGLGYALWYSVLPKLPASVSAVVQLTVPPLAMAGGMLFLGEALTLKFALASAVILGGLALSVLGPRYFTSDSKGS